MVWLCVDSDLYVSTIIAIKSKWQLKGQEAIFPNIKATSVELTFRFTKFGGLISLFDYDFLKANKFK